MAAISGNVQIKQRLLLCIILDYGSLITVTDFIWDTEVKSKRKNSEYVTRKKVLKSCSYQAWPERCLSCVSV